MLSLFPAAGSVEFPATTVPLRLFTFHLVFPSHTHLRSGRAADVRTQGPKALQDAVERHTMKEDALRVNQSAALLKVRVRPPS
jgi:hypothetical protein